MRTLGNAAAEFFTLLARAGCTYCDACRCYLPPGHRHTTIVGPFLLPPAPAEEP